MVGDRRRRPQRIGYARAFASVSRPEPRSQPGCSRRRANHRSGSLRSRWPTRLPESFGRQARIPKAWPGESDGRNLPRIVEEHRHPAVQHLSLCRQRLGRTVLEATRVVATQRSSGHAEKMLVGMRLQLGGAALRHLSNRAGIAWVDGPIVRLPPMAAERGWPY